MIGLGTLFKKNINGTNEPAHPPQERYVNRQGRLEIRPRLYQDICGLCGRTLLTGEQTNLFTHPEAGNSIVICPHCRDEARQNGWSQAA